MSGVCKNVVVSITDKHCTDLYNTTTVRTCAFELASPHAFSRSSALGAVGRLAAGFGAVAGQKNLSLVDSTVMLRRAANGGADTSPLRAVCAPLALKSVLQKYAIKVSKTITSC